MDGYSLLHPSAATSLLRKNVVMNHADRKQVVAELSGGNLEERIIRKHVEIRKIQTDKDVLNHIAEEMGSDIPSGLGIHKIVSVWININKL